MKIRLIVDPPRRGSFNMAIDEYLMQSAPEQSHEATLRFYSWESLCVTIGYFQSIASISRLISAKLPEASIVRRITGGGLVTHGRDLTFSLAAKSPGKLLPTDTKSSYLKINEAVRVGLKGLFEKIDYADCKTVPSGRAEGERICFERASCYDLLMEGKKILGASQRRKNGALLHQSSIFLNASEDQLIQGIVEGFKKVLRVELFEKALDASELEKAQIIEKDRYTDPEWSQSKLFDIQKEQTYINSHV